MAALIPQITSNTRAARTAGWFAVALTILTFALMVLGAAVRALDAGLACPDWPLCHGQVFPPFDPVLSTTGPVPTPLQMNAEWTHRFLAALISAGLFGLGLAAWRSGLPHLRRKTMLAGALLLVQILFGAATVLLGNSPNSVAVHLAMAMAFLVTLSWVARLALGSGALKPLMPGDAVPASVRKQARFALAWLGALMLLGVLVATTAGADLVCPWFPGCGRDDYAGVAGLVTLQMLHRFFALTFWAWVMALAWASRPVAALRTGAWCLAGLATFQVAVGVANVFLQIPPALSALHLGTAVLLFLTLFHWSAPEPALQGAVDG